MSPAVVELELRFVLANYASFYPQILAKSLIFEHENEETSWFEHLNQRQGTCGGKECKITEFSDQLAATWHKDNRPITLIGIRDEQEVDLLANAF